MWSRIDKWVLASGVPQHPAWLRTLYDRYMSWRIRSELIPAMLAAQETKISLMDGWMPPATTPQAILDEITTTLAPDPAVSVPGFDLVRVLIAHCPTDVWEAAADQPMPGILPQESLIVAWEGPRQQWPSVGYAVVQEALPIDHDGIYLMVNRFGDAVTAALTTTHPTM